MDAERTSGNLLGELPADLPQELFQVLMERPGLRIERICSRGHSGPAGGWYDQSQHEWVVLLQGQARLRFEDEPADRELASGDYLFIAARRRHRVSWTDPDHTAVWLAIHFS